MELAHDADTLARGLTRELEYHLRLQKSARNVLAPADDDSSSALARRLFDCATINGAASIGFNGGRLEAGAPADFFTVDLEDLSALWFADDSSRHGFWSCGPTPDGRSLLMLEHDSLELVRYELP